MRLAVSAPDPSKSVFATCCSKNKCAAADRLFRRDINKAKCCCCRGLSHCFPAQKKATARLEMLQVRQVSQVSEVSEVRDGR